MLWRTPRQTADTRLSGVLHSICARMTAPLRMLRRLLPGRTAGEASAVPAPAAGPFGKELARQVFHRGMRQVLRLPGGRRASRLLRSIGPGPVEYLARRYRAYERRAMPEPDPVADVIAAEMEVFAEAEVEVLPEAEPPAALAAEAGMSDLSEAEDRLYRQFAARGLAADAMPQGSDRCRPGAAV